MDLWIIAVIIAMGLAVVSPILFALVLFTRRANEPESTTDTSEA